MVIVAGLYLLALAALVALIVDGHGQAKGMAAGSSALLLVATGSASRWLG